MFVLDDNGVKAECVVTKEAEGVYELKNVAVVSGCRRRGYGKKLIDFLFSRYPDCRTLLVGTGDFPSTLGFYRRCGFTVSYRVKNFFTDNYDHPIFEARNAACRYGLFETGTVRGCNGGTEILKRE